MITVEEAKQLTVGDELHETGVVNADGTCKRWRVNGKPKTWKRQPERVAVPIKHGLYSYDTLNSAEALMLMHKPDDATCVECQKARQKK